MLRHRVREKYLNEKKAPDSFLHLSAAYNSAFAIALALLCRCIGSVRHECATEGITVFYSMLTHNKVDNGTHRGKDTLYCVDVHTLFKAPVYELSSL